MRGLTTFAALALLLADGPSVAQPAPSTRAERVDIAAHVAEAAQRFVIPEDWIYAVMRAESGGRIGAVSSAGAMGLMQLMPGTWARQRARFGLGDDPFDPRDNIMAGTSYLREMYDRYGAPGFLAAYNAGPGRFEDYARRGRPLPSETIAYVARIAPQLQSGGRVIATLAASPTRVQVRPLAAPWTQGALFIARSERQSSDAGALGDATAGSPNSAQTSAQGGLFAPVSPRNHR